MKKSILSRMLISLGIVAFSVAITAGACKKNGDGDDAAGGLMLEVKAGGAKIASVSKDGNKTHVKIVMDEAGKKVTAVDDQPAFTALNFKSFIVEGLISETDKAVTAAKKVLPTLFTVGLKDKTSGLVFSVLDKTKADTAPKFDDDTKLANAKLGEKPQDGAMSDAYAYITAKHFSIVSMYLTEDTAFTNKTAKDTIFGMICTSEAADLKKAQFDLAVKVAKNKASESEEKLSDDDLKSETLKGLELSTCRAARTSLATDAVKWTALDTTTKALSRDLLFIGVDTGAATLADLAQVAPLAFTDKDGTGDSANGLDKTTLGTIGKKYPTVLHQVKVTLVKELAAAADTK